MNSKYYLLEKKILKKLKTVDEREYKKTEQSWGEEKIKEWPASLIKVQCEFCPFNGKKYGNLNLKNYLVANTKITKSWGTVKTPKINKNDAFLRQRERN